VSNKGWSVLFGVTMIACFVGFAISPLMNWWRPDGVSTHSKGVDDLFDIILGITAFFFVLTEAILVAFMWLYAGKGDISHPVSEKADFPGIMKPISNILQNQHRVEMAWTFVPAVILLYIAFAQVSTWANIKYEARRHLQEETKAGPATQIGVSARQFEWRMRYPSTERFKKWLEMEKDANKESLKKTKADYDSFGKIPQASDVHVVNELHVWKGYTVTVHLTTRDVIHSFNLPNFRVKQDALPGKMIPVWFTPTKANCKANADKTRWLYAVDPESGEKSKDLEYDIPCAELCGWGHYRMIGRVFVHKDQADFAAWLAVAEKASNQHTRD